MKIIFQKIIIKQFLDITEYSNYFKEFNNFTREENNNKSDIDNNNSGYNIKNSKTLSNMIGDNNRSDDLTKDLNKLNINDQNNVSNNKNIKNFSSDENNNIEINSENINKNMKIKDLNSSYRTILRIIYKNRSFRIFIYNANSNQYERKNKKKNILL